MLYLGIDQHRNHLTVNLRDEDGSTVFKRQVSTRWSQVRDFFVELRERTRAAGGWVAIVEVCGFNDWLLELLQEYHCREGVLIQPSGRNRTKTDCRHAGALSELLWINRHRLLGDQ